MRVHRKVRLGEDLLSGLARSLRLSPLRRCVSFLRLSVHIERDVGEILQQADNEE